MRDSQQHAATDPLADNDVVVSGTPPVLTDAVQLTRHMATRLRDRGEVPVRDFADVRRWLAAVCHRARCQPAPGRANTYYFVIPSRLAAPLVLVVTKTRDGLWCVTTVLGGNAPATWIRPGSPRPAQYKYRRRNPRRRRHQEPPEISDS